MSQDNVSNSAPINTHDGKQKCLEVVQLIIDGEACEKDLAYFKNNIECCSKSMEQYNLHKELKECLKRVSDVCPPDNLADCIKKDLNL